MGANIRYSGTPMLLVFLLGCGRIHYEPGLEAGEGGVGMDGGPTTTDARTTDGDSDEGDAMTGDASSEDAAVDSGTTADASLSTCVGDSACAEFGSATRLSNPAPGTFTVSLEALDPGTTFPGCGDCPYGSLLDFSFTGDTLVYVCTGADIDFLAYFFFSLPTTCSPTEACECGPSFDIHNPTTGRSRPCYALACASAPSASAAIEIRTTPCP